MNPEQLRFTDTHEWVHLETTAEGKTIATVGLTDHAVEQLNDLVYIQLPEVGQQVRRGESFGEVESVKAVSDLYSPVDGEVVEVNQKLTEDLDPLSQDPYGAGWLIKVQVNDPSQVEQLMDHQAYQKMCEEGM